jgi:hypothetical protein
MSASWAYHPVVPTTMCPPRAGEAGRGECRCVLILCQVENTHAVAPFAGDLRDEASGFAFAEYEDEHEDLSGQWTVDSEQWTVNSRLVSMAGHSPVLFLPCPSAMLLAMEKTDRRI